LKTTAKSLDSSISALERLRPSNPKRPASSVDSWYGYYAGYADSFVKDIVGVLPSGGLTILDPWNGSGTTTAVATHQSLLSQGFDMNPAAVVIAKARILRSDVASSIASLTDEILNTYSIDGEAAGDADLLTTWLVPSSASFIRSLEARIRQLLIGTSAARAIDSTDQLSSLAALFYLGLFRTVRTLLTPFVGSNPTWIRRNVASRNRLRPNPDTVSDLFRIAMNELTKLVKDASNTYDDKHSPCRISLGSSDALPIEAKSIDAVITSPPYCTRIDYVVATLPELAVLGLRLNELKGLRDKMIGTPTVPPGEAGKISVGCRSAEKLLDDVAKHSSKASGGYYRRFFSQYLDGMSRSLAEIRRVARDGSPAVLVVQDSFYKEIHIDLATIISDMSQSLGWKPVARHNFPVVPRRNYATINPRSRAYREKTQATESVLVMGAV
jgi:DNA modification methylase